MIAKVIAASAVIGSAVAYMPSMSMDLGRRQVVQTGAAAAAVTPFLQSLPAGAMDKSAKAPVITIFDHRGCKRGGPDTEYKGNKANSKDDEMCVKVQSVKISVSEAEAAKALQEFISFTSKGTDGVFNGPKRN